jgi:hypothetical protein
MIYDFFCLPGLRIYSEPYNYTWNRRAKKKSTIKSLLLISKPIHAELSPVLYGELWFEMSRYYGDATAPIIPSSYASLVHHICINTAQSFEKFIITIAEVKAWVQDLCNNALSQHVNIKTVCISIPTVTRTELVPTSDDGFGAPWTWLSVWYSWKKLWEHDHAGSYE